jgi:hypothetical protein
MTPDEMEAEIIRLRAVCEAHDVDPDWQPPEPEPEQFGPPTAWEWRMSRNFEASTRNMAELMMDLIPRLYDGPLWPDTGELRIKVPDSFTVNRIGTAP